MPERFTNRILRVVRRSDYEPVKRRALARTLKVSEEQYDLFCRALEQLEDKGQLLIDAKAGVRLPDMPDQVWGTYQGTNKGYGFVIPDTPFAQGDVFVPFGQALDAVTGDRVVAQVSKRGKGGRQQRSSGRIRKILSRGQSQFVGTLEKQGKRWVVAPDGKRRLDPIVVDDPGAKDARLGDKVVVEVLRFGDDQHRARGVILEKLGKSGTSQAELKAIIRAFGLEEHFSRRALHEARQAAEPLSSGITKTPPDREDIRRQTILTIDPNDARDFDDAISLRKIADGQWILGVHIADVSHFVTTGSTLDAEAKERATSVYLPHHVLPMLPELLSNGVCSLQENQDRFVKTAYIKLDSKGKVLSTRFANSLMRSAKRLTYEDAEHILAGKTDGYGAKIIKLVQKMEQLAKLIVKRRRKQGMLTLDLPKAELIYDKQGHVIDARPESTSFPHKIIEMFMLEANDAVARLLDSLNVAFLRRIHPEPDTMAMGDTAGVLKVCGYTIPKNIDRKGMQKLLDSARGKPESFVVNLAVLKSLQRAEYSPAAIGHFALASQNYCHFTSPIRRYPDLDVHRLLQAYLHGELTAATAARFPGFAEQEELGRHCSDKERNADAAENELRTLKIMQMLTKHIGEETNAVVTSVTNFGLFAQVEKYLVEGLIRAEDIHDRRPSGKQGKHGKAHRGPIKGTRGKFIDTCPYRIGQAIRVKIANVSVPGRTLDLVVAD